MRYAKQLNALMIGEEEATYLGVNVNRLKWIILSVNVVIVAVATAFTGVISFVGLVVTAHTANDGRGQQSISDPW